MATKIVHFVSHYCGPQECDCSPRCHAREGDEIVTSSSVAAVTCKNCLRGLRKDRHPGLPQSTTIAEERDQLKAENEALRKYGEEFAVLAERRREEVETLRKERDARHPFKPFHEPAIGFTGCVICGVYTDHGGLPCPKTRATADAAMGKGEQS